MKGSLYILKPLYICPVQPMWSEEPFSLCRDDLQTDICTVALYFPLSQATCERGFAAMEESHQKVIDELQRKHQRELENLKEEKERLLAEETAATIAGKYHQRFKKLTE